MLFQEDDLFNYFRNQLHVNDNQLFVVVTGDNNNWIVSESTSDKQQNNDHTHPTEDSSL